MVKYVCERCDYSTNKKIDITRHYKRKKPCTVTKIDVPLDECLKSIEDPEYVFDEVEYLRRRVKQLEKDKADLLKQNNELILRVGNNNNSHNTIINMNNNYVIAFKDTDYNLLAEDIVKYLNDKNPVPKFGKLVEKIHFSGDFPQNHNVYKPNFREDRVMVYDGQKFMVDHYAVDTIMQKLEHMLESRLDPEEHKDLFKKLHKHYALKQKDGEYKKATDEEINLTLYNNREITQDTKRKMKTKGLRT